MINMSEEREKFSKRMHVVCERIGLPKERRQTLLAKKYQKTPTTGRNWLTGEKIPDYETALKICADARVNYEWLMRGVGIMESGDDQECVIVTDPDLIRIVKMAENLTPAGKKLVAKEVDTVAKLAAQMQAEYGSKS